MKDRNKALIITGVLVFLCGVIAFLVGGWIAGWDFVAFFKSATFMWICILLGIYALTVIIVLIYDWYKNKL